VARLAKFTRKMVLRAVKNLTKNFSLIFDLKAKNRLNYWVFSQNYVQKQETTSIEFVTRAAKKTLFGHSLAMYYRIIVMFIKQGISKNLRIAKYCFRENFATISVYLVILKIKHKLHCNHFFLPSCYNYFLKKFLSLSEKGCEVL
jgi:hypothetical protein